MPRTLRQQLDEAKVEIYKSDFSWIIPRCQLNAILTYQTVVSDISFNCPELDKKAVHNHATVVVERAKSLYATLVLIKQSTSISRVLDEGIFDADLPLVYWKPNKKQTTSFSTISGRSVNSLESWPEDYKRKFAKKQWSTLVKVFSQGKHYELDKNDLLPFMPLEEGEDVPKHGAYGKVYPARFHPSHHDFKLNGSRALVAVKELLSPDEKEFQKEVDVLKMLGSRTPHNNLIQLLATFKQGNQYNLIFPWAQGNLRKYWEENANPDFDASTVMWSLEQMAGITDALMLVHNFMPSSPRDVKGGVRLTETAKLSVKAGEERFGRHGDIKPENILWFDNEAFSHHAKGVLKLADFGLGRFHGKYSRSGLSPSGIIASPTYQPPECQLRRPVSRSYDIWSLGCVLLEFVTWLMKGNSEIAGFSEFRGTENIHGIDDDNFFTIIYPNDRPDAIIRPKVVDWVRQLREHERCSQLICDLLEMIMTDLLLVNSGSRISAKDLNLKMQRYCEKARGDKDYMLKPNPCSATSRPGLVTSHSSLVTPQQPIDDQQITDLQTPGITVNGVLLASPRIPENLTFNNLLNQGRNGTWPPTGRRDRLE